MEMKDRIRVLRKELCINQEEFGRRLGVARNTIANYETGARTPMEQTIKSICREFNVNSLWLVEGKGEMFSGYTDDLIQSVAEEYNLNDFDIGLVRTYLELDKDSRQVIMDFIQKIRPE